MIQRPPIGLIPIKIWEEQIKLERYNQVKQAILRYLDNDYIPNPEWIREYNDLNAFFIQSRLSLEQSIDSNEAGSSDISMVIRNIHTLIISYKSSEEQVVQVGESLDIEENSNLIEILKTNQNNIKGLVVGDYLTDSSVANRVRIITRAGSSLDTVDYRISKTIEKITPFISSPSLSSVAIAIVLNDSRYYVSILLGFK